VSGNTHGARSKQANKWQISVYSELMNNQPLAHDPRHFDLLDNATCDGACK
jgi:hypothetical protein